MKKMSAEKIAPMAVFLCSDAPPRRSPARSSACARTRSSCSPRPQTVRSAQRSDGWTPETIASELAPTYASSFRKPERTRDIFTYDPI